VSGEYAVMELCSISANNKWDFVVTWLIVTLVDIFVWVVYIRIRK
jgi:hypothetical protein